MTADDKRRWDERHAQVGPATLAEVGPPAVFAPHADRFPTHGTALEVACGRGTASVWLAQRGLDVLGVDVSPVAVEQARALADAAGVRVRCRFEVVDLDDGLPDGPPVDVLLCHRFRDARLDVPMAARLAPHGLLAVSACSEVGAGPGRYRVGPGELAGAVGALADLAVVASGEGGGDAWVLARRR